MNSSFVEVGTVRYTRALIQIRNRTLPAAVVSSERLQRRKTTLPVLFRVTPRLADGQRCQGRAISGEGVHTCSVLGLKPTGVNACCQPRTPRWTTIIRKYLVKSSARKCHLAPKKQSVRCHCIARRCQGDANSSERHQNTAAVGTRPQTSLGQLQGGRVARKAVRRWHWCRFELPIQNKWDARDTCDLWLGRGERGRRNSETCISLVFRVYRTTHHF